MSDAAPIKDDAAPEPAIRGPEWLRFLYNHNPFYLLSTCFLLDGSARLLKPDVLTGDSPPIDPWPVVTLVGGYVSLMAITAFLVVRFGKVWDDARSMLVIVLLLFVEIAVSFDQAFADPQIATWPAFLGLPFAILVSEFLLRGLRIRLPMGFRLPYYLLLGLIFLYPVVPVEALRAGHAADVPWLLYLFSPIAGLSLLTLLPAIRRGPEYLRENGTPWLWPMFPWTIFVVLLVGLGLRSYALPQAFDPVLGQTLHASMEFSSVFGAYFLVPLVFAVAVLLLEIGLVGDNRRLQKIALGLPFGCLLLSLPVTTLAGPDAEFLARFTRVLGHPVFVTSIAIVAFMAVARLRRAALSEELLLLSLIVLGYTHPRGTWFVEVEQPAALVAAGVLAGVAAIRQRGSSWGLLAAFCFLLAARPLLEMWFPSDAERYFARLVAATVYGVALVGWDGFATKLRPWVAAGLTLAAFRFAGTMTGGPILGRGTLVLPIKLLVEQIVVVGAAVVLAVVRTSPVTAGAAGVGLVAPFSTWCRIVYEVLIRHPRWIAIRSVLVAAILFSVALVISLAKAGAVRWLLERVRKQSSLREASGSSSS